MKYKQLNPEQRHTIECFLKQKISKRTIAVSLNMNESSIHREDIKRNSKPRGCSYTVKHAQMLADERKKEGRYKTVFSHSMKRLLLKR